MPESPEGGESRHTRDTGSDTGLRRREEIFASYSGPLPPAGELQRYDEVLPGLAEKIVAAWLEESDHRRAIDRTDQQSFYKLAFRGQWMAAVLAAGIFSGSVHLVLNGHDLAGLAMVLAEIAALSWAFIAGRKSPVDLGDDDDARENLSSGPQQ